ncbi:basic salivary proline-rich protein 4-like [Oryctolagus cuniculus]|uniref:basic salivary proline-rich protein 4-like n=1 Tax=Oryctolagus cuniculus TaxID=9986 RepID=UPI003879D2CA
MLTLGTLCTCTVQYFGGVRNGIHGSCTIDYLFISHPPPSYFIRGSPSRVAVGAPRRHQGGRAAASALHTPGFSESAGPRAPRPATPRRPPGRPRQSSVCHASPGYPGGRAHLQPLPTSAPRRPGRLPPRSLPRAPPEPVLREEAAVQARTRSPSAQADRTPLAGGLSPTRGLGPEARRGTPGAAVRPAALGLWHRPRGSGVQPRAAPSPPSPAPPARCQARAAQPTPGGRLGGGRPGRPGRPGAGPAAPPPHRPGPVPRSESPSACHLPPHPPHRPPARGPSRVPPPGRLPPPLRPRSRSPARHRRRHVVAPAAGAGDARGRARGLQPPPPPPSPPPGKRPPRPGRAGRRAEAVAGAALAWPGPKLAVAEPTPAPRPGPASLADLPAAPGGSHFPRPPPGGPPPPPHSAPGRRAAGLFRRRDPPPPVGRARRCPPARDGRPPRRQPRPPAPARITVPPCPAGTPCQRERPGRPERSRRQGADAAGSDPRGRACADRSPAPKF